MKKWLQVDDAEDSAVIDMRMATRKVLDIVIEQTMQTGTGSLKDLLYILKQVEVFLDDAQYSQTKPVHFYKTKQNISITSVIADSVYTYAAFNILADICWQTVRYNDEMVFI